MSHFDPATFATMTFTEANSTESVPLPAGEWPFTIEKQDITAWQKRDDPTVGGLRCSLTLKNESPELEAVTGRKRNRVRHEVLLDLTPEGGLDFGRGMNVALGRVRAACGLNRPGVPFTFDQLIGHDVRATVKHEIYQDKGQAKATNLTPI